MGSSITCQQCGAPLVPDDIDSLTAKCPWCATTQVVPETPELAAERHARIARREQRANAKAMLEAPLRAAHQQSRRIQFFIVVVTLISVGFAVYRSLLGNH